MGEQLVKEKKLGLEILPLNFCQADFSIKSSKHDISSIYWKCLLVRLVGLITIIMEITQRDFSNLSSPGYNNPTSVVWLEQLLHKVFKPKAPLKRTPFTFTLHLPLAHVSSSISETIHFSPLITTIKKNKIVSPF